jgi:peptidoglycan hydrolase-like protein with peptidoglycan-binding domain
MIASGTHKDKFWVWRKGNWGHTQHIHVSFTDKAKNDGSKFDLPIFQDQPARPPKPPVNPISPIPFPGNKFVSYGKKNNYVKQMQEQLIAKGYKIPAGATGNYFAQTQKAVKQFYRAEVKTTSDGRKMGPKAWNKLFGDK